MNGTLKDLDIKHLKLDDQNPRLPKYLRGKDEATIIEYMVMEASTLDLMLAIGQNGFFPGEPLLVVKEGKDYRVIEGNRRLTALKLLKNPALAKVQSRRIAQIMDVVTYKGELVRKVPCQVFKDAAPIHKYLGYRHITGVQSWDLTQKAAFLSDMHQQEFPDDTIEDASGELAKMIGSRRDYVKRLLVGYEIFKALRDNAYFKVRGLNESTFYFNYIADSLRQPEICSFLRVEMDNDQPCENLHLAHLRLWTQWFFEKTPQNQTRLKATAEELKMLNTVLATPRALAAFKDDDKSLREAFELTGEIEEVFQGAMATALNSLETADGLTHRLETFYDTLSSDLVSISKLVRKIRKASEEEPDDEA